MEVREARKVQVFDRLGGRRVKNQVCSYWLAGKCNRTQCRFMHRESPPPQTEQPHHLAPPDDIRRKQSRMLTWRNPNYNISKMVSISRNEGGMFNSTSDQSTLGKVLANTGKSGRTDQEMAIASIGSDSGAQAQPNVLTAVRAGHEKISVRKALPKQCKYWVTGNCVHGDKCKNLHSWFSGSGFTMLAKLEGHTKMNVNAGWPPVLCRFYCYTINTYNFAQAITGISLPSGCDKLYSGGKDGTVRAWDCNSGQCAGSAMIDGEVGCLVAEGPWLLVGFQNAVKAWNLQNHAEFSLNGPAGLVCSMVMDNDKLFAGIEDGTILVWKWHPEPNIPEPAAMLKEHNGAVCSLIIGANRLYSGSRDCTIKVWDLQNLQCLQTLYGHTRDVMSVLCWDSYLISASLDNTLKVWAATESGTIEVVYEIKEDYGVIALCGIHDAEARSILLCSFTDKTVRLYDLPSFTERGRIFSKQEVQVVQIGINGLFFTGDATGEVSVWKLLGVPCATAS